ncbi:putative actin patch assembly and actin polymerization protein [Onygenales sp. PD_40]|nr:putative actin patch assembly and actin polymerization protein [Onygenales sp. PD_40]KAK2777561.1 putative actin patch assembly and actin polymerization protein [Emmonsiellopsis sp. PD_33]
MGLFDNKKKPYSAITVHIDRLTSEQYEVDDSSGIVDLVEVIRLQPSGPTEASRALRKKLKYGSIHRQLRALTILDFLIQNAGDRYLRGFADEPLLERLRVAATDPVSDREVKDKCRQLFLQWNANFQGVKGMERICNLHSQLPKRKRPVKQQQSKVLRETEAHPESPIGHSVSISAGNGPSTVLTSPKSSKTSKSGRWSKDNPARGKPFNLEKERPEVLQSIASASMASTNLLNALKLVNREHERVSQNAEVMTRFDQCKNLRRQILKYIQVVESDDFLGSLIHANDELVTALIAFEVLDKSVDDDSDSESESEMSPGEHSPPNEGIAALSLGPPPTKPPRPARPNNLTLPPSSVAFGKQRQLESDSEESEAEDEDDEDNPFGDRNAVNTPHIEKSGLTW